MLLLAPHALVFPNLATRVNFGLGQLSTRVNLDCSTHFKPFVSVLHLVSDNHSKYY